MLRERMSLFSHLFLWEKQSWITRALIYAKSSGTHPSNKMQPHCDWYQAGGRQAETSWQRAEKGTRPFQYVPFVHKCMLQFFGIAIFWYVRECSLVDRHQHCLYLQGELQREGVLTVYCSTQRSWNGPLMADIHQKLVHQAGCMFSNPWH
jgi:hypothetical protein